MHEHASEELLFEVSFFSAHSHIVQGRGQSSLDQTVQNVADVTHPVILVFTITGLKRDCLLLPMLESFRLVEILHSIKESGHKIASIFLFMEVFPDCIP